METRKDYDIRQATTVTRHKIERGTPPKYVLHALNISIAHQGKTPSENRYAVEMIDGRGKNFTNEIDYQNLIFLLARAAACKVCQSERTIQKFNFNK